MPNNYNRRTQLTRRQREAVARVEMEMAAMARSPNYPLISEYAPAVPTTVPSTDTAGTAEGTATVPNLQSDLLISRSVAEAEARAEMLTNVMSIPRGVPIPTNDPSPFDSFFRISGSTSTLRGARTGNNSPTPSGPKLTKEERKQRALVAMTALSNSRGLKGAEQYIRCGLEFEFHKLEGEFSNRFDEEGYQRDLARYVDGQSLQNLVYHWISHKDYAISASLLANGEAPLTAEVTEERIRLRRLVEYFQTHDEATIEQVPKSLRSICERWIPILRGRARERWETRHRREYVTTADSRDVRGWDTIASQVEMGEDASVRGGEIRTLGGRTIREFLQVCRVLSRNPFEVDTACSFHIHLSLEGIKHNWGARFQAEMYAYLLRNTARMPSQVQKRLMQKDAGVKYAKFMLENGHKYVAIYRHDTHNTWEFRLFGGVQKYSDMVRCLSLAVDTLRHAYSVKLGITPSLLEGYGTDEVEDALRKLYPRSESRAFLIGSTEPLSYDPEDDATRSEEASPLEDAEDGDGVTDTPPNWEYREVEIPGLGLDGFFPYLESQATTVRKLEEDAA